LEAWALETLVKNLLVVQHFLIQDFQDVTQTHNPDSDLRTQTMLISKLHKNNFIIKTICIAIIFKLCLKGLVEKIDIKN
jgi:hypothetical protein